MISQINIYVADIVWILCDVYSAGQNSLFIVSLESMRETVKSRVQTVGLQIH